MATNHYGRYQILTVLTKLTRPVMLKPALWRIRNYFFRILIRGYVILYCGSGSKRPINNVSDRSGSNLDILGPWGKYYVKYRKVL
jgi:hypothetical protein